MARPLNEINALKKKIASQDAEMFRLRTVMSADVKRLEVAKRVITKLKDLADSSDELRSTVKSGEAVPVTLGIMIDLRKDLFAKAKEAYLL